jgi:uncharacterized C2H2 Zn-finger protein
MTDPNPYHCPICDASFKSIEDVEKHKSQQHRGAAQNGATKDKAARPRKSREFTRTHME